MKKAKEARGADAASQDKRRSRRDKAAKKPATAAKKPGKAKTPAKAKTPPKVKETPKAAKAAAKVKKTTKAAKAATFTPVALPVKITSQNGMELEVTAKSIKLTHGLNEVIFDPASARIIREDVSESGGRKLPYTVKAGSVVLRRGDFCVTFAPEKTAAINAILTAREAARAAKKGGAR